jgi:hypothetical protein
LFHLYKLFQSIGPTNGKITAENFLEMDEFKYCAFKKFLPKAFHLKIVNHSQEKVPTILQIKKVDKELTKPINHYESVGSINLPENENENQEIIKSTKFNKLILNDNKSEVAGPENQENKTEEIDFKKFCYLLKIFGKNYPVDLKIKCNIIIKSSLL